MVWDEMDSRVKENQQESSQHMWAFQLKLVEKMPRVCKAVIKAKGGYLFHTFLVTT
jgi:hypothetical protein